MYDQSDFEDVYMYILAPLPSHPPYSWMSITALAIDTMYDLLSLLSAKMIYCTFLGNDTVIASESLFPYYRTHCTWTTILISVW